VIVGSSAVDPVTGEMAAATDDTSNSGSCPRVSRPIGIDKVALAFDIVSDGGRFRRELEVLGHRFWLNNFGTRASFELNPSRMIDPFGSGLATVDEALESIGHAWDIVKSHVTPVGEVSSSAVTRLDLARDFTGVREPAVYLQALALLDRPYQQDQQYWTDRHTGEVNSVRVGSKANFVRMYRKDLQAPRTVQPGTIRWEWQGRSRRLKDCGILTLGHLTSATVEQIAQERWSWSKAGTPVAVTSDPFAVFERLGYSDTVAASLFCDNHRMVTTGALPPTDYRRKRLKDFHAAHGLVVSRELGPGATGGAFVQYLDWDTCMAVALPMIPAVVSPPSNIGGEPRSWHRPLLEPVMEPTGPEPRISSAFAPAAGEPSRMKSVA